MGYQHIAYPRTTQQQAMEYRTVSLHSDAETNQEACPLEGQSEHLPHLLGRKQPKMGEPTKYGGNRITTCSCNGSTNFELVEESLLLRRRTQTFLG